MVVAVTNALRLVGRGGNHALIDAHKNGSQLTRYCRTSLKCPGVTTVRFLGRGEQSGSMTQTSSASTSSGCTRFLSMGMSGMQTDIVDNLRRVSEVLTDYKWQHITLQPSVVAAVCRQAANEIERLRGTPRQISKADPSTSRKAAASVGLRAGSQRHRLLMQYWIHGDLTDEEAGDLAGLRKPNCTYWARLSELRSQGLIEQTGITRPSSVGEQQNVCRITELGLHLVEHSGVA